MVRRADHQYPAGRPIGQILMGDPERKPGLARRGRRGDEIVFTFLLQYVRYGPGLPVAQQRVPRGKGHDGLVTVVLHHMIQTPEILYLFNRWHLPTRRLLSPSVIP